MSSIDRGSFTEKLVGKTRYFVMDVFDDLENLMKKSSAADPLPYRGRISICVSLQGFFYEQGTLYR